MHILHLQSVVIWTNLCLVPGLVFVGNNQHLVLTKSQMKCIGELVLYDNTYFL